MNKDNNPLRKLLDEMNVRDGLPKGWEDSPIAVRAHEVGEQMGFELASQRYQEELRSLRTIIDAMIESK
tara:strand:- start:11 stop:217 length:207 start_codon:yes stop_codon:yes gene_type:complete